MNPSYTLINGDSAQILKYLPANCIDLIVTSPPYCNQRQKVYGGIKAEYYVQWFMPIAQDRILSHIHKKKKDASVKISSNLSHISQFRYQKSSHLNPSGATS